MPRLDEFGEAGHEVETIRRHVAFDGHARLERDVGEGLGERLAGRGQAEATRADGA